MDTFEADIKNMILQQAKIIQEECEESLRAAILEAVYQSYIPVTGGYERTNQLLNSISSKIDTNGNIMVYVDTDKLNYISNDGENVSEKVPWWIEQGHTQKGFEGLGDQYRDYEARSFLELAESIIKSKFGNSVITQIINADPR